MVQPNETTDELLTHIGKEGYPNYVFICESQRPNTLFEVLYGAKAYGGEQEQGCAVVETNGHLLFQWKDDCFPPNILWFIRKLAKSLYHSGFDIKTASNTLLHTWFNSISA